MITLVWGFARVFGLRLLSMIAGPWTQMLSLATVGGVGLLAVWWLWQPGDRHPLEHAVLDALGARETIVKNNTDEERRDNAWMELEAARIAKEREDALRAPGADADRVVWRADDAWLRGKRQAAGR